MDTRLLTTEEVAVILHCSRRYVYQLIGTGDFPKMKVGKKYLIPADELDRWVHNSCAASMTHIKR